MADLLFLFQLVKVMAEDRSVESMCLEVRQALDLAALPKRFGVPWRDGRWIFFDLGAYLRQRRSELRTTASMPWSLEVARCNFLFFRVLYAKLGDVLC